MAALRDLHHGDAMSLDLVDEVGFPVRYASVRHFVRHLQEATPPPRRRWNSRSPAIAFFAGISSGGRPRRGVGAR